MTPAAKSAELARMAAVEKALGWARHVRDVTTDAPLGFGPSDLEKMLLVLADEVDRLSALVRLAGREARRG